MVLSGCVVTQAFLLTQYGGRKEKIIVFSVVRWVRWTPLPLHCLGEIKGIAAHGKSSEALGTEKDGNYAIFFGNRHD
jgi:hypothetical protein